MRFTVAEDETETVGAWLVYLAVYIGILEHVNVASRASGPVFSGTYQLARFATFGMSLLDEIDFALDCALSFRLLSDGQIEWGYLLLASSLLCQIFILKSKRVRNFFCIEGSRFLVFAQFETYVFFAEDFMTVTAFVSVPGLFDAGSETDIANLVTTLLSGGCIIVAAAWKLLRTDDGSWRLSWDTCKGQSPDDNVDKFTETQMYAFFGGCLLIFVGVGWIYFVTIEYVILQAPLDSAVQLANLIIFGIACSLSICVGCFVTFFTNGDLKSAIARGFCTADAPCCSAEWWAKV